MPHDTPCAVQNVKCAVRNEKVSVTACGIVYYSMFLDLILNLNFEHFKIIKNAFAYRHFDLFHLQRNTNIKNIHLKIY